MKKLAKVYQFPIHDRNGNYYEAYIDWQYEEFYNEEAENLRLNPNYYQENPEGYPVFEEDYPKYSQYQIEEYQFENKLTKLL